MPEYHEKMEKFVAEAFRKALRIVNQECQPDVNDNSKTIAAAFLAPCLIEIDLDDETQE